MIKCVLIGFEIGSNKGNSSSTGEKAQTMTRTTSPSITHHLIIAKSVHDILQYHLQSHQLHVAASYLDYLHARVCWYEKYISFYMKAVMHDKDDTWLYDYRSRLYRVISEQLSFIFLLALTNWTWWKMIEQEVICNTHNKLKHWFPITCVHQHNLSKLKER